MTEEKNVENDALQADNQSSDDTANESVNAPKSNKRFAKRFAWFVVLIAVVIAAYWGYTQFPSLFDTQEQPTQIDPVEARLEQLDRSVARIEQQAQNAVQPRDLDKMSHTDQELKGALNRLRTNLDDLRQTVQQTPAEKAAYWRLIEIKQTLAAAARMMWSQEDDEAALQLLKLADKQLVGIDSRVAIRAREKLAIDIERVKRITKANQTDLALQLVGLQQRIEQLPDNIKSHQQRLSSGEQTVSDDLDDWQTNLASNWQSFLDNFIRIQSVESAPEPLLAATQRLAINQRIQLIFTLAQQAAVKNNDALWQRYLEQLAALIVQVKGEQSAATDVVERLQQLAQKRLDQPRVKQLESLSYIAQAIEQGDAS